MRKKIEELRNKEDGFTLVELLAVIVILGIIVAIAIPMVGNVTDTAETNAQKADTELIIDAARLYDIENKIDETNGVKVTELINAGYLDLRGGDENTTGTVKVQRTTQGGTTYDLTGRTYSE